MCISDGLVEQVTERVTEQATEQVMEKCIINIYRTGVAKFVTPIIYGKETKR